MAWGLRQRDDAAQDMDIFDACISGIAKGKTNVSEQLAFLGRSL